MTAIRRIACVAVALALVSAAAPATSEEWERRGNAAFADENYAEAARCYAIAEERGTEPGRIAFNHGAALFRTGKYRDAERLFRCALESAPSPERKARALYNLGTCLLHAADGRDARRLAEAVDCFTRCLNSNTLTDEISSDARQNLELAKVQWRNAKGGSAAPPESDAPPGDDPPPDKPPETGSANDPGAAPGAPNRDGSGRTAPAPMPGNGAKPTPVPNQPQPGAGQMSPIPEDQQFEPLPPREARELLRQAVERITRERRALQRTGSPVADGKGYPNW